MESGESEDPAEEELVLEAESDDGGLPFLLFGWHGAHG